MANQKIILNLLPRKALRITVVDSDGGAATFTDFEAATSISLDRDYTIVSVQGQGTTAPATATALEPKVNGTNTGKFFVLAAIFDPKSSQADRLGALAGARIKGGSTLSLIGRA